MSFIDDMKVKKKQMNEFLILLLIPMTIAALGYVSLQDIAARHNTLYEKVTTEVSRFQG